MLRVSLHLLGAGSTPRDIEGCKVYSIPRRRGSSIEVWTWCKTVDDFLVLVEKLLENGFVPVALGLLNGRLVPVRSLDFNPEALEKLATVHTTLTGVITLEVYQENPTWITALITAGVERLRIDYKKKRATIEARNPITTIQFYDNKLRVTKPKKIPP